MTAERNRGETTKANGQEKQREKERKKEREKGKGTKKKEKRDVKRNSDCLVSQKSTEEPGSFFSGTSVTE
ncbi:hypothetical protein WN51_10056 [Melipona quadrifasciata]|uniref:Uncharacterized protein n=1 Tax=Melipona quadrifasciata TaxID=166423 RepID=A0A0N0BKV2_9HYME|nr:hypothetical protein WN51_10056 [Melipona quadrifasciata]